MKFNMETDYIITLPFKIGDTLYTFDNIRDLFLCDISAVDKLKVIPIRVVGYKFKNYGVVLEYCFSNGLEDIVKIADGSMVYREAFLHNNYIYRDKKEAKIALDNVKIETIKEIRKKSREGEC